MSRLVRLYPEAWRRRYEAELLDLLEARPLSTTQAIDLVRGAIDAHLHPHTTHVEGQPWTHRLPGVISTAAGLIWSSYALTAFTAGRGEEWGDWIGIAILLMFIGLPGDYMAMYGRRIAAGIATVFLAIILASSTPWSLGGGLVTFAAGAAAYLLAGAGMLTLAAIRAGIGSSFRKTIVVAAVLLPTAIALPIAFGLAPSGRDAAPLLLAIVLPYGIAWILIGLRMTLRGAVTVTDSPLNTVVAKADAQ